jgi:hypothetical protein
MIEDGFSDDRMASIATTKTDHLGRPTADSTAAA